VCLYLHLHHFQSAAQDPTEYIRIPQLVLCPAIIWELDKVRERVLVEDQRELLIIARPIRDRRRDIEEDLEPNLRKLGVAAETGSKGSTSL